MRSSCLVAFIFVLGVLAMGCDPEVPGSDAGRRMDAGTTDGGARMDAIVIDAPSEPDAGMDAAATDAGAPCSVGGVPGVCIDVSLCVGDRAPTPGFCPGPAAIQCCTPRVDAGGACDPADMPTPNAGLTEEPGSGGCPPSMVRVDTFCIDRFEASLVLVDASGPIGSWSPFHEPRANRVMAVSLRDAVPQGYISGTHAGAACAEAGKRLCTDSEWLRACRGTEGRIYPYGDTRMGGVCNDARATHPAIERFGTSASWIWSQLGDACINQLPDSLAPTGSHPGCVTPEGVFDLMGNLHEWTADPAGTFRGGFYVDTVLNGEGCLYRTTAHDVGHWDYSTGFRCCR